MKIGNAEQKTTNKHIYSVCLCSIRMGSQFKLMRVTECKAIFRTYIIFLMQQILFAFCCCRRRFVSFRPRIQLVVSYVWLVGFAKRKIMPL